MNQDSSIPPAPQMPPLPAANPKTIVRDAAVLDIPPALAKTLETKGTIHIEGKVISSDPASKEIRIATPAGEVVIRSPASLPPGSEVALDLTLRKAAQMATLTLIKQQIAMADTLQKTIPPANTPVPAVTLPALKPLRIGDSVIALRLPAATAKEGLSHPGAGAKTVFEASKSFLAADLKPFSSPQTQVAPPQEPLDVNLPTARSSAAASLAPPPMDEAGTPQALLKVENSLREMSVILTMLRDARVDMRRLPASLQIPLPAGKAAQILRAPDIFHALQKLPSQGQKDIVALLPKLSLLKTHEIVQTLQKIQPPLQEQALSLLSQLPPKDAPDVLRALQKIPLAQSEKLIAVLPRLPAEQIMSTLKILDLTPSAQTQKVIDLLSRLPPADIPDALQILQKLPPLQMEKAISFLQQPAVVNERDLQKLLTLLPPAEKEKMLLMMQRAALPAPPASPKESSPAPPLSLPPPLPTSTRSETPLAKIVRHLIATYMPHVLEQETAGPANATPVSSTAPPDAEMLSPDKGLAHIIREQPANRHDLRAKTAPSPVNNTNTVEQSKTVMSPPSHILGAVLKSILPILETMELPQAGQALQRLIPFTPQASDSKNTPLALPDNVYQVKVIGIDPPGPAPSFSQPPVPATFPEHLPDAGKGSVVPLQGQVESFTKDGAPIVKTPEGHFVFKTAAPVPQGSWITFDIKSVTAEQIVSLTLPHQAATPAQTGFSPLADVRWPAMQETLQILTSVAPDAAESLRNVLPTAVSAARLPPTTLLFLAALRSGVIEGWLGDSILQPLKQSGKKELLERLGGDFTKISTQAKEFLPGEWRAISMPLLHDDHVSQMQFFVRDQQEQEKKEGDRGGKTATRFILNLHLSRMGDMQLDGLLHKKRLDLVLRSAAPLPAGMRRDLTQRFAQGLAQTPLTGEIGFQTRSQHWVNIDLPAHTKTVI